MKAIRTVIFQIGCQHLRIVRNKFARNQSRSTTLTVQTYLPSYPLDEKNIIATFATMKPEDTLESWLVEEGHHRGLIATLG